jgi:hypothetical protein
MAFVPKPNRNSRKHTATFVQPQPGHPQRIEHVGLSDPEVPGGPRCLQPLSYLPANSFWPLQGVESGIFLVLALALAFFTYWSITTRVCLTEAFGSLPCPVSLR